MADEDILPNLEDFQIEDNREEKTEQNEEEASEAELTEKIEEVEPKPKKRRSKKKIAYEQVYAKDEKEDKEEDKLIGRIKNKPITQAIDQATLLAVENMKSWIALGESVTSSLKKTADEQGYENVGKFVTDAVNFFIEYRDEVLRVGEENKKLKAQLALYRSLALPKLTKLAKIEMIRQAMIESYVLELPKDYVKIFSQQLEGL